MATGAIMDDRQADARLLDAKTRALYQQLPMVLAVNVVNAAMVAAILGSYLGDSRWWLFFAVVVILTIARLLLWLRYRALSGDGPVAPRWALLAAAASGLSGLVWGIGSFWLFPHALIAHTFLAFVIGGMCAGALASLSYHLPTFAAYVATATLPLAARFFLEGGPIEAAMAAMILVFAAALAVAAYNSARSFERAIHLQLQLRRRSDELTASNAQLNSEIADRLAAEAQLRQAQKMEALGQLTGGIAHDFNNLLTAVIGQIELAQRSLGNSAQAKARLERAFVAAQRGTALTQGLLAFARRQHLEPKPVDVPAIIGGIKELLSQSVGPAIRLVIEAEALLYPARTDPNQLELALLNLALNARDAMPEGGTLRIEIQRRRADPAELPELTPGDYVVILVSDTGTGMDRETIARAFEPFFTTKEAGRGSGLGLPMVQGFAAQSGGAVHIDSAIGHGTTVQLWLPRAEATPVARDVAEQAEVGEEPPHARILVCDDDADVCAFVSTALRDGGYRVWETTDPTIALNMLEGQRVFDLLLTDYAMPKMSGETLIKRARQHQPELPVLLMTGHVDVLRIGGIADVPLLTKPFKLAELNARVARALSPAGNAQASTSMR